MTEPSGLLCGARLRLCLVQAAFKSPHDETKALELPPPPEHRQRHASTWHDGHFRTPPHTSSCCCNNSPRSRSSSTAIRGSSSRLAELSKPKYTANRRHSQQRRKAPPLPPPMGMPLAHYWAARVVKANMRRHGGGGRSSGDVAERASQLQADIFAAARGRPAWDDGPDASAAAEALGWNNDFGGAGADVSLARPLLAHVAERRAKFTAWDVDLAHPPKAPLVRDPHAVRNQQQAAAMGMWHQLRQSYRKC